MDVTIMWQSCKLVWGSSPDEDILATNNVEQQDLGLFTTYYGNI